MPRLIHVDWDSRWVDKNFPAKVSLTGDLSSIVRSILEGLQGEASLDARLKWIKGMRQKMEQEATSIRQAHPGMHYLDVIRGVLPRESTLVIDNTQLGYWAEYFYPSYCPGGLIGAKGSSTIGFAFAAAIGVKIACADRPVMALIGDGGFLYSTQELATCLRHGIGFPVVVVNDNAYGVIAYLQRVIYKQEYESRLVNPDFVALARAYGIEAASVDSPDGLHKVLRGAFDSEGMWLIELARDFPEPPFSRY